MSGMNRAVQTARTEACDLKALRRGVSMPPAPTVRSGSMPSTSGPSRPLRTPAARRGRAFRRFVLT
jgi:hypothetical protein